VGSRQHSIEFVELRLWRVVVRKSDGALHLADDRVKCAIGMLRRAETTDARVRLVGEPFHQRGSQSRLADARFT
jgi:hypothetical protein